MSSSSQPHDSACSIFCLLWAIAALLHIIWDNVLLHSAPFTTVGPLSEIVLACAAAAVIQRPSSVRRLLLLAAVQVLQVGYQLPYTPNHWLLTGFVNLTILCAAIGLKARAWRSPLCSAELYRVFTPAVRLAVIIFYFFTFFHKLNADFLDPSSSCAATFIGHITDLFSVPSLPALAPLAIFVTLGVEGALPIGLAIPRLRLPAVLLGAGFHFLLALDIVKMFYNFSSVMVALLWVFVPPAAAVPLVRVRRCLPRAVRGKPVWRSVVRLFFNRFHFLAGYGLTLVLCWFSPDISLGLNIVGFSLLWLALAGTLCVAVGYAWRPRRVRKEPTPPLARHPSQEGMCCSPPWRGGPELGEGPGWVPSWRQSGSHNRRRSSLLLLIPCLVLLNGLGPYLGLKLRSAWQMYSNLRVDDAGSNHFLIPRSLDIGGFLADSVVIVSTSDGLLNEQYVETGARMPYFALHAYLAEHPEVELAYIRSGQYRAIARAGDSPEFSTRPPLLLRKLLTFRPLGQQAGKICDW